MANTKILYSAIYHEILNLSLGGSQIVQIKYKIVIYTKSLNN